jgi:two-component system cell cycle sensor histidine kinase/response regulator CckA
MKKSEARAGIEPANSGFADRCLTTWLPRHEPQPTEPPQGVQGWQDRGLAPSGGAARSAASVPSATARLRDTLDYVADGVVETSADGRIKWLNTAALALLGLPPNRAHVGIPFEEFAVAESLPVLQAAALHALGNGAWIGDTVLRHAGGSPVPVTLVVVAHTAGRDKAVTGWSYVLRTASSPLRERGARADARRFEAIGRLAVGVAHDVQNALTEVVSSAEELAIRPDVTGDRRDDVHAIRDAAERASALVRQLATYEREPNVP